MAQTQPYGFACEGGLDVNKTSFNLQETAGVATQLLNYEVDGDGGYRRINGCAKLTNATDSTSRISTTTASDGSAVTYSDAIKGITGYSEGIIAVSAGNIFYTYDASKWVRINRISSNTHGDGDSHSTFISQSLISRTTPDDLVDFTVLERASANDEVIICDGKNSPLIIKISDTGDVTNLDYLVKEITITSHPNKTPTASVIHRNRMVAIGDPTNPNTGYYSDVINGDICLSGGTSGSVTLEDKVIGVQSFRDNVILFCKNSIYKIVNLGDATNQQVVPISKNIGCVSKNTIQEIGGDLIFLAQDGLRTLAATDKIDDTELGTVSRPVNRIIVKDIVALANTLDLASVVIKEKNQYRLFYSASAYTGGDGGRSTDISESKGIGATLTSRGLQFFELEGMQCKAIASTIDLNNTEVIYHGDRHGAILTHDVEEAFFTNAANANIRAVYRTPFLDFGDMGTQKTLSYVNLKIEPEGIITPVLGVRFGEENYSPAQPADITMPRLTLASNFGEARFFQTNVADFNFGALSTPLVRQAVQGSGNTIQLKVTSDDQQACYVIQGLYINYYPSGRR